MIYEDLKGKKVLVAASSSGIGSATAIVFSKKGSDQVFWPVSRKQE